MEEKQKDTFSRLVDIIQNYLLDIESTNQPKVELTPKTRLYEDLGMDSLDRLALGYEIEDDFDISIPDGEMGFVNLGECVKYIDDYKR